MSQKPSPRQKIQIKEALEEYRNSVQHKVMYGEYKKELQRRGLPEVAERTLKRYISQMKKGGPAKEVRHSAPQEDFISQIEEEKQNLNIIWNSMQDVVNYLNLNHGHALRISNRAYLKNFKHLLDSQQQIFKSQPQPQIKIEVQEEVILRQENNNFNEKAIQNIDLDQDSQSNHLFSDYSQSVEQSQDLLIQDANQIPEQPILLQVNSQFEDLNLQNQQNMEIQNPDNFFDLEQDYSNPQENLDDCVYFQQDYQQDSLFTLY